MDCIYTSKIVTQHEIWRIGGTKFEISEVSRVYRDFEETPCALTEMAALQLTEYLEGRRTVFQIPLNLRGTPFQKEVWHKLKNIPYGTAVSYSDLAVSIHRPNAVRAVGQAVGKNPCLVLLPCHRVLGKNGTLTGFSAGLDLKKRLLALEHIPYRSQTG